MIYTKCQTIDVGIWIETAVCHRVHVLIVNNIIPYDEKGTMISLPSSINIHICVKHYKPYNSIIAFSWIFLSFFCLSPGSKFFETYRCGLRRQETVCYKS